jgi:hypothetical protein
VLTGNVAESCPAAIITDAGTVAAELLLERLMETPPGPAAPFKVTTPVDEPPPPIAVGLTLTELRAADVIVNAAV